MKKSQAAVPFAEQTSFGEELERRVAQRTAELTETNEQLRKELAKYTQAEGNLRDIDDRKRAEALLAGEKRLLEMVASGCSLAETLDALCRIVEDVAGSCYCGVYLIDPSGKTFHNAAAPSLPTSFNDPIEGALVDRETGPCGMAACLTTQVIASDIASDSRWPTSVFRPLALAKWSEVLLVHTDSIVHGGGTRYLCDLSERTSEPNADSATAHRALHAHSQHCYRAGFERRSS